MNVHVGGIAFQFTVSLLLVIAVCVLAIGFFGYNYYEQNRVNTESEARSILES